MVDTRKPAPALTYETLSLPRWRFEIQVVFDSEHVWIPLATFCKRLGIASQMQVRALLADSEKREYMRQMPVQTTKGERDAWCLRRDALAAWLFDIDSARVKADIRGDIREFRLEIIRKIDEWAFPKGGQGLGTSLAVLPQRNSNLATRVSSTEGFALFLEAQIKDLQVGQQQAQIDHHELIALLRAKGLLLDDHDETTDDACPSCGRPYRVK